MRIIFVSIIAYISIFNVCATPSIELFFNENNNNILKAFLYVNPADPTSNAADIRVHINLNKAVSDNIRARSHLDKWHGQHRYIKDTLNVSLIAPETALLAMARIPAALMYETPHRHELAPRSPVYVLDVTSGLEEDVTCLASLFPNVQELDFSGIPEMTNLNIEVWLLKFPKLLSLKLPQKITIAENEEFMLFDRRIISLDRTDMEKSNKFYAINCINSNNLRSLEFKGYQIDDDLICYIAPNLKNRRRLTKG